MKKLLIFALCTILLTGCVYYNDTQKEIVNLTVARKEEGSRWSGKFFTRYYNVYFDIGNGKEWEVNNSELFDILKENDTISVLRTNYLKDGKVVKTEYKFIN